jgi:hypothetical protein
MATDAQSVVAAHLDELVGLAATVIRSGVKVSNQKRISIRFRGEQKSGLDVPIPAPIIRD